MVLCSYCFISVVLCQNSSIATDVTTNNAPAAQPVSAEPVITAVSVAQSALENSSTQADNEVSQINQSKPKDLPPLDANMQANAQVCICSLL